MRMTIRIVLGGALCAALALALASGRAGATALPGDKGLAGRVTAEAGGRTIHFPSLKTDIVADIQGDLVTVAVTQTFVNPTATPLNARYLFPLHKEAAVFAMTMEVGEEVVQAKIREREEARQTFEQGKREGKAAALLEQHRPNMFTQEIANLMPGEPIKVTLKYTQTVPRIDGGYELAVPLVVGPRYIPAGQRNRPQVAGLAPPSRPADMPIADNAVLRTDAPSTAGAPAPATGVWQLGPVPDYPDVAGLTIPATIDADRVSIRVTLASGMPIAGVMSTTHALATTGDAKARTIALAEGRTVDNRDFILRYTLSGSAPQAGLLAHRDARGGTFSLLIEPPQAPADADISPREMVFVLDTSGSMSGLPIEASKTFMRHALQALRPADTFRIIRFSSSASELASGPIPATPSNIRAGTAYVESLRADGGTEVVAGLRQAYGIAQSPGTLRIVVFLSDGYVGNEPEILRMVSASVGQGRLYAFGIGSAVNRYLIEEMARHGRGLSRIIDPTEKSHEAAIQFASRLKTPVLTDIQIDWGSLKPRDVTPALIPDSVRGRFDSHPGPLRGRRHAPRQGLRPGQRQAGAAALADRPAGRDHGCGARGHPADLGALAHRRPHARADGAAGPAQLRARRHRIEGGRHRPRSEVLAGHPVDLVRRRVRAQGQCRPGIGPRQQRAAPHGRGRRPVGLSQRPRAPGGAGPVSTRRQPHHHGQRTRRALLAARLQRRRRPRARAAGRPVPDSAPPAVASATAYQHGGVKLPPASRAETPGRCPVRPGVQQRWTPSPRRPRAIHKGDLATMVPRATGRGWGEGQPSAPAYQRGSSIKVRWGVEGTVALDPRLRADRWRLGLPLTLTLPVALGLRGEAFPCGWPRAAGRGSPRRSAVPPPFRG